MTLRWVAAISALAFLAGCASLSEKECRAGDWRNVGIEDGRWGETASRIEQHREACAPHGVIPDAAAYEAGRLKGLARYCTADGGFAAGRRGGLRSDECPAAAREAFLDGFSRGAEIYRAERELDRLRDRIQLHQALLMQRDLSAAEREHHRRELYWLYDAEHDLRLQIWRMEMAWEDGEPTPGYFPRYAW